MGFQTLDFADALNQVRDNKAEYMIRAVWLENTDYVNRIIVMKNLEKYIHYAKSCVSGHPKSLWLYAKKKGEGLVGSYAKIESDDILASDWLDLTEWTIANNADEYNKILTEMKNKK